jgi:hypothetical protein
LTTGGQLLIEKATVLSRFTAVASTGGLKRAFHHDITHHSFLSARHWRWL